MKIKTFRDIKVEVQNNLEVYVPINDKLGLPNSVEIDYYDNITNKFILVDKEDSKNEIKAKKKKLSDVLDKEIFYYSRTESQNVFTKAIKCLVN